MSHYTRVEIDFKDEKALIAAIRQLGYTPTVSQTPIQLFGFRGDQRQEVAHIVIPREQIHPLSNDIGFLRTGNHFELIVSEWDTDNTLPHILPRLKKEYARQVAILKMRELGFTLETEMTVSGKLHLVFH